MESIEIRSATVDPGVFVTFILLYSANGIQLNDNEIGGSLRNRLPDMLISSVPGRGKCTVFGHLIIKSWGNPDGIQKCQNKKTKYQQTEKRGGRKWFYLTQ